MKKHIFLFVFGVLVSTSLFAQNEGQGPSKNYERLVSTIEVYVRKDGSSVETVEFVNEVSNEIGRSELSIQKVHYVQSEGSFSLVEAYSVLGKTVTKIDPKTVRIGIAPTGNTFGLSDLMEATIPFNQIAIGSEVHLKYKITKKPFIGNVFADGLGISNEVLAKKESYKFISEVPLNSYADNIGEYYALKKTTANNLQVIELIPTMKAYDFQGIQIEGAKVFATTAKNWAQIRNFVAPQYKRAWNMELPPKMVSVVAEAKAKTSDKEKIELIADRISKMLAYSGNWVNKSGKMFPAGLALSLKRGKGDCKDYSTAMIAMLRKLGFEAYPFLTFRSMEFGGDAKLAEMSKVASPNYFNHVIVWAKGKDGKVWWVDPTNPHVQADVISSDILGNFGLLLDDKSTDIAFLPKQNAATSDLKMEHTININPDNSITGAGSVTMTPSTYNVMMLAEKSQGQLGGGKVLGFIINPASKTMKVTYNKSKKENLGFDYSFHANDFVQEQMGKFKGMVVFNPIGLMLNTIRRDQDSSLGEIGTSTVVTHIKGQKEIDVIRAGCLVRSKWIDADRTVENKPDEVVVTDVIKVKSRFISRKEASGDKFDVIASDYIDCAKNSAVIFKIEDSMKTAQVLEEDKIKGASFETMTEKDADLLFNMTGPKLLGYRNLKVFRYYQKKVQGNKNDSLAYYRMAISLAESGYISGGDYIPEYLDEAQTYFDKAVGNTNQISNPKYAADKIKYLLYGKKSTEAAALFSALKKQYPKDVNTLRAGHLVLVDQKRYDLAEKWLKATVPLNKTDEDKYLYHKLMEKFYYGQKKYREAIPHQEYLANKNPNDAWGWHNLAILHYELKDYDKNIELEKKALAISEFGMAKRVISQSFMQKAIMIGTKDAIVRHPASEPEFEKLLLESIKYDTQNAQANGMLAKFYVEKYINSHPKDPSYLSKGKIYFQQAVKADPNHEYLELISILIESAETMAKNQSAANG